MRKAARSLGAQGNRGRNQGQSRSRGQGQGQGQGRGSGRGSGKAKNILSTVLKVLLLLVLLAGVALGVRACVNRGRYDWDNLQQVEGSAFLNYTYGKKEVTSLVGVDVSEYQGQIDWNTVASAGIQFAIVRIGNRGSSEGYIYIDEQYSNNINGARVAGLPVGVYFFSQATTVEEAEEEADFVLAQLNNTEIQLPVFYDHEPVGEDGGRAADIDKDVLTQATSAFCSRIEEGGYQAMYYGNSHMFDKVKMKKLKDYGFWYAEYGVSAPSVNSGFLIWQYASDGQVPGIPAGVDLDLILDKGDFDL